MSNRSLTHPFPVITRIPAQHGGWMRAAPVSAPSTLWAKIREAYKRHRTRTMLAQLDSHLLKDIGISYAEAEHEANKPFWRS
jgi:uncharacterized protein YjiS (DUF1127 family)